MVTRADIVVSRHIASRMFQRRITIAEVLAVINANDVIEEYPTDTPYPSVLGLGVVAGRALHVVWAFGPDAKITLVTVYEPTQAEWDDALRVRRT